MIDWGPRDQLTELHETETDYYETKTETKKNQIVSRSVWSQDLNISGQKKTVASLR